jgi:molecular chaperone HscA
MPNGRLRPLDIGRVAKSRLDDASIRSEIHIDEQGKYVRYGERAITAKLESLNSLLYEPSPKLWLRDPDRLGLMAAPGLNLTRENLLAGLIANALHACVRVMDIGEATLRQIDIRIAHPVWPANVAKDANAAIARICAQAQRMVFDREWATVTVTQLESHTRTPGTATKSPADVVEPIAAAVELLPSAENVRRVCAVIDVGAGTTDIGLFQAVAPDSASMVRGKLYPLGEPVSVFKAGNVVDEIVLEMLRSRATRPESAAFEDVKARIRQVKETLFHDGFVQELGVTIRLEDLRVHPDVKLMAREIRNALEATVQKSCKEIVRYMDARTHYISKLEVVMAGGGANIDFIRKVVEKPFVLDGKTLKVSINSSEIDEELDFYGAGRERMAVAMGGARSEYDLLIHQMAPQTRISRGPL